MAEIQKEYLDKTGLGIVKECIDTMIDNAKYQLPTATTDTLGGIKVGTGLSIDSNGTLNSKSNIWIGTQKQYDEQKESIPEGTFIIITDAPENVTKIITYSQIHKLFEKGDSN